MPRGNSPNSMFRQLGIDRQLSIGYFLQGLRTGLPIALGYFPSALAFGVVALAAGFSPRQAMLVSILVFSGAGQFMAVNLFAGGAAPMAIIMGNLVVNLRYFVMSASLSRRLRLNWLQALCIGFGVTDETFVMSYLAHPESKADYTVDISKGSEPEMLPPSFVLGVNSVAYVGWVTGTFAGTMFADVLPMELSAGMGIVLYAMFIALLIPAVAGSLGVGVVAVASGGCCWLLCRYLSFGWAMVSATTVVAGLGVCLWGKGVDDL